MTNEFTVEKAMARLEYFETETWVREDIKIVLSEIKRLRGGIEKHRYCWGFEVGQVNSTYYSKRDQELYKLLESK